MGMWVSPSLTLGAGGVGLMVEAVESRMMESRVEACGAPSPRRRRFLVKQAHIRETMCRLQTRWLAARRMACQRWQAAGLGGAGRAAEHVRYTHERSSRAVIARRQNRQLQYANAPGVPRQRDTTPSVPFFMHKRWQDRPRPPAAAPWAPWCGAARGWCTLVTSTDSCWVLLPKLTARTSAIRV